MTLRQRSPLLLKRPQPSNRQRFDTTPGSVLTDGPGFVVSDVIKPLQEVLAPFPLLVGEFADLAYSRSTYRGVHFRL